MQAQASSFHIYDVSNFPLVVGRAEAMLPGYAARWRDEMTALVGQDRAFVLIHSAQDEEAHEDRKQRALWLKQYKEPLGRSCKALIHIEPEPDKRAAMAAQARMAVKAFGVPVAMAATMAEALALGSYALAAATTVNADAGVQDGLSR